MKPAPPDSTVSNKPAAAVSTVPTHPVPRAAPPAELVADFRGRLAREHQATGLAQPDQSGVSKDKAHYASTDGNPPRTDAESTNRPGQNTPTSRSADQVVQTSSVSDGLDAQLTPAWQMATPAPAVTGADTATAVPSNAASFAALLERHVRLLLVSDDGPDHCGAQMMFRLADEGAGDTDLTLSRTPTGWLLEASTQSQNTLDNLRELSPELKQRFARHRLGDVEIRTSFRDDDAMPRVAGRPNDPA